jgi:hypothetical protein
MKSATTGIKMMEMGAVRAVKLKLLHMGAHSLLQINQLYVRQKLNQPHKNPEP